MVIFWEGKAKEKWQNGKPKFDDIIRDCNFIF
jgi:hypothetical protein